MTGLAIPELLRSSHIKPWSDCETDAERLDIWNGFLLAPHLDAAFDRGFLSAGIARAAFGFDPQDDRARQDAFHQNPRGTFVGP
ncbi:MAG: HNH endonuclease [Myxococcales bacterium]|nr:HNH endonuclease [Myxococcales bacterium]